MLPIQPMLADASPVSGLAGDQWAFEPKWDGFRGLVEIEDGQLTIYSRSERNVSHEFLTLGPLLDTFADYDHVVLDGEVVVCDEAGVPRFNLVQNHRRADRVQYWAFDLLAINGTNVMSASYRSRRQLLEKLGEATGLVVPALIDADDGAAALAYSRTRGWEGIVAKRLSSTYIPGYRGSSWLKGKNWLHQEVVIGGWRWGTGSREGRIGALMMGIPGQGGLDFVGAVGTGFTNKVLDRLLDGLSGIITPHCPFNSSLPAAERRLAVFVDPLWVGEVQFGERTERGILRQPSWRGLRTDKKPSDVRWEN
jgi:bifunctional non-homologous end joining protein LigD